MDLKECIERRIVKNIKPDHEMAKSLVKDARNKIKTAEEIKLSQTSSSSLITLYYDALRGKLEALALKKGFKIYNHECYYAFLKEILQKKELAEEFNRFRKIRNNINYYGEEISISESKEIRKDIILLIKNVKKIK